VYSGLWRLALRWTPPGPLRAATRRLNFKANHRKLVIADDGGAGLAAVVSSADPYDLESAWSNVAARLSGRVLEPLLASELAVARFSGWSGASEAFAPVWQLSPPRTPPAALLPGCAAAAAAAQAPDPPGFAAGTSARVQLLSESAIREALLARAEEAGRGEAIDVAMFYLADRAVAEALLAAARRGVAVRLILDPNEDATTTTTSGVPNQPVASELVARSGGAVHVRWYRTHGERFHSALVMIYGAGRLWMTLGSADLTRRGLDGYNLEANVAVEVSRSSPLARQVLGYFDTLWSNHASLGIEYTADFAAFADPSQSHYWLSRLLEGSGFSAF
jgi:phosphatidylserine/phosphatidylglycerophosphate/cardiolipin synthase-like enzyme